MRPGYERDWIEPYRAEPVANRFVFKVSKMDSMCQGIRKRDISFAGTGEIGEEFDGVADVDYDKEGWPSVGEW